MRLPVRVRYPLAVSFGFGVAVAGLIPVLGLAPTSPTIALLPEWLRVWWQLSYILGGLGLSIGILARRPGIEAMGLALLGGPFLIQAYLAIESVGAAGVPGAVFLVFISIGCWARFFMALSSKSTDEQP